MSRKPKLSKVIRSVRRQFHGTSASAYPLHKNENIVPVFIVGSGRSGNTLLRRMLMGSPEIYIPPETYVIGKSISEFEKNTDVQWQYLCRMILSLFSESADFSTFPTQDIDPLLEKISSCPEETRSYAYIIDQFFTYMASQVRPSASRWGDKTPLNAFCLDEISRAFPKARYVHIVRNGIDVVASYLKMGRYTEIESACRRWIRATHACRTFGERHPHAYLELRYEDVVENPVEGGRMLFDFAGIEFDESMIIMPPPPEVLGDVDHRAHYRNVQEPVTSASIGRGRRMFSDRQIEQIMGLIGDQLREFGYPQ